MLIGPQTFSAAEDFLVSFDVLKRGVIVGEASGGSTGQPMFMSLPGGGQGRICVKRDTYPDGTAFVGKGIAPSPLRMLRTQSPYPVASSRASASVSPTTTSAEMLR